MLLYSSYSANAAFICSLFNKEFILILIVLIKSYLESDNYNSWLLICRKIIQMLVMSSTSILLKCNTSLLYNMYSSLKML